MKKKITFVAICMSVLLLIWLAINVVDALQFFIIRRQANEVDEPFYTLVIDGEIIEHSYVVQMDRFYHDSEGNLIGYDDGRVEVPLLTVLSAMGAKYEKTKDGVIDIEYCGKGYILVPKRQAMYTADILNNTDASNNLLCGEQNGRDEHNLLLIWPEKKNSYFFENDGEYIVDISSLHNLCFNMGFTFQVDKQRGIVFFYSETALLTDGLELPSH